MEIFALVKPCIYLAAPFTAASAHERSLNIHNVKQWLRWFVINTEWAIGAPWIPYVETLDEEHFRDRGMADNFAFIARCDLVVFVGDRMSSGMHDELLCARRHDIRVLDLTEMRLSVPPLAGGEADKLLKKVVAEVFLDAQ